MKPLLAATLAAVLVSGAALAQSSVTAAPPANPTGSAQYQNSGPAVGAAPGGSAAPAPLGYQGATTPDEPAPMHRARRHHRRHRAPASTDAMGSSGTNVPTANPGSTK